MEKNYSEKTSAASLPLDVLVFIFSFLDTDSKGKAAQVCTSWEEASNCKLVWKSVEVKLRSKNINIQSERSIIKRGIRRVDVGIFDPKVNEFLRRIPNLEYLRITCCCVKENILKFWKTAPNSTEISSLVSEMEAQSSGIVNLILEHIAPRFRPFHKLNPYGCQYNSIHMLKMYISGMKKLKELNLYGCINSLERISDVRINHIAEENMKNEDKLTSLEKLSLKNLYHFQEKTFEFLSQTFVNLVSLDFVYCRLVSNRGLVHLFQFKNLKILGFVNTSGITDEGLNHISRLTNLKVLYLCNCNGITGSGFALISRLVNLKCLNLGGCSNVTDATLKQLNELTHLRELDLQRCNISDVGLLHLAESNLKLTELNIANCHGIGDHGLLYISKSSFFLRKLIVSGCNKVTDDGIMHIVKKFSHLQVLDLKSCKFVTEKCRRLIAEKFHQNKTFKLYGIGCDFDNMKILIWRFVSCLKSLQSFIT